MMIPNEYKIEKDIAIIYINNQCGKYECIVDIEQLDKILKYRWYIKFGYAYTNFKRKEFSIHRFLIGKRDGLVVDHINRNKLDNRMCNLRFATKSQNGMNRNTKGYYWNRKIKKYSAVIRYNNKKISLGNFDNENDALQARITAEKKYYGSYALNRNDTTFSP